MEPPSEQTRRIPQTAEEKQAAAAALVAAHIPIPTPQPNENSGVVLTHVADDPRTIPVRAAPPPSEQATIEHQPNENSGVTLTHPANETRTVPIRTRIKNRFRRNV